MSKNPLSGRGLLVKMDLDYIQQQKKQYRQQIQQVLKGLDGTEIARQSSTITRKAIALPEYKTATTLSIFLPMPGKEISTQEIVKQAFKDGKKVYVPYIHPSRSNSKLKIMDMLRLKDEDDLSSLRPDAWGIPSLSKESIDNRENALGGLGCFEDGDDNTRIVTKLDLIFMPSMAFDSSLNRLGHGKGFYDRYLSLCQSLYFSGNQAHAMPQLIGLALKEQMLSPGEEIPTTELDWKVDQVITAGE